MKHPSKPSEIEGAAMRHLSATPDGALTAKPPARGQSIWKSGGSSGQIEGDWNDTVLEVASP